MEFPIGLLRTGRRHGTIIGTPFRGRVHIIGLYGKLRTERVDIERIVECGLILREEHLAVICVLPEGIRLRISRYLSAYRGYGSVVTAVKPGPDREADRMTVGQVINDTERFAQAPGGTSLRHIGKIACNRRGGTLPAAFAFHTRNRMRRSNSCKHSIAPSDS